MDRTESSTPYFWMMTIQFHTSRGTATTTRTGTTPVGPDTTYTQVVAEVTALMRREAGLTPDHTIAVMSWTLAPENLGGAR